MRHSNNLIRALAICKVDYCNSVLAGILWRAHQSALFSGVLISRLYSVKCLISPQFWLIDFLSVTTWLLILISSCFWKSLDNNIHVSLNCRTVLLHLVGLSNCVLSPTQHHRSISIAYQIILFDTFFELLELMEKMIWLIWLCTRCSLRTMDCKFCTKLHYSSQILQY